VSSGRFNSASEVHRAALAAMLHQKKEREIYLGRLRGEIELGLTNLETGRCAEFSNHQALDRHLDSVMKNEPVW